MSAPAPKALACYGLLVRWTDRHPDQPAQHTQHTQQLWLRFIQERPVSTITTQFLAWCCDGPAAVGKTARVLVGDNASWHVSAQVRAWIRDHNQHVRHALAVVRIVVCGLPVKSRWLNRIEPKWVHGKRAVVEPDRLLTAAELAERVCAYYQCAQLDHLTFPQ